MQQEIFTLDYNNAPPSEKILRSFLSISDYYRPKQIQIDHRCPICGVNDLSNFSLRIYENRYYTAPDPMVSIPFSILYQKGSFTLSLVKLNRAVNKNYRDLRIGIQCSACKLLFPTFNEKRFIYTSNEVITELDIDEVFSTQLLRHPDKQYKETEIVLKSVLVFLYLSELNGYSKKIYLYKKEEHGKEYLKFTNDLDALPDNANIFKILAPREKQIRYYESSILRAKYIAKVLQEELYYPKKFIRDKLEEGRVRTEARSYTFLRHLFTSRIEEMSPNMLEDTIDRFLVTESN